MIAKDEKNKPKYQYSICISGAASGSTVEHSKTLAERLGRAIAKRGHIVITGATVGLPFYAAKGAKEAGGMSIGFSPAASIRDHMRRYRLPTEYFDFINFTGMNYVGRDTHLVQSADAVITVGGRFGSLHEFVTAIEINKDCGVLLDSQGTADIIPELMKVLEPPHGDRVLYDKNPENLVAKMVDRLDESFKDINADLAKQEHWFLNTDKKRAG
jgi:uncharacterized protein (TIGR00725 family)